MTLEKERLGSILKGILSDDTGVSIVDVSAASAVGKWENYFSEIERVSATAILSSGRRQKVSLIVKKRHSSTRLKKITIDSGLFVREIAMYQEILPKMEELANEFGTDVRLWPRCYGSRLHDTIILEDLRATGYKMTNRLELMDLQMGRFVMNRLGLFHAVSHILLEKSDIPLEIVGKSLWQNNAEGTRRHYRRYTKSLCSEMVNWGDEWKDAMERLKTASSEFLTRHLSALICEPTDFKVLNHGDMWTNNIMFKFEPGSEQPLDLKLIDWQASFVGNPAEDLHKFFITSVKPDVLENHVEDLLTSYCDSVHHHLTTLGSNADEAPTVPEMKRLLQRTFFLRLGGAIIFTANAVNAHEGQPDFEEVLIKELQADAEGSASVWNVHSRLTLPAKKLIQLAIKEAIQLNVI